MAKAAVPHDEWVAEVAPSAALRTWFGHRPERFAKFATRYRSELDGTDALDHMRQLRDRHDVVTLLYAARDEVNNHAVVLRELLQERAEP